MVRKMFEEVFMKFKFSNLFKLSLNQRQKGKKLLPRVVVCLILFLLLISIGKLLCFELFTNVSNLRKSVGQKVIYKKNEALTVEGVLKECKYEFNDKLGFFSLRITIEGTESISKKTDFVHKEKYTTSNSLSVFDVKKITGPKYRQPEDDL